MQIPSTGMTWGPLYRTPCLHSMSIDASDQWLSRGTGYGRNLQVLSFSADPTGLTSQVLGFGATSPNKARTAISALEAETPRKASL
jgi:hypothetical protein